jgi:hypothetical protein
LAIAMTRALASPNRPAEDLLPHRGVAELGEMRVGDRVVADPEACRGD